jgi:hypothetical protein
LTTAVAGGSAEIGLGADDVAVVENQDLAVELGPQGLYMFVVNARVQDLDVGAAPRVGGVEFGANDATGQPMTTTPGCRELEFAPTGGGFAQLTAPYYLPFERAVTPVLEGAHVTIQLAVRDPTGRQATAQVDVVAHLPP